MRWIKIVALAFVLAGQSVGLLVGFFRFRSAGIRAFRRELLESGFEPEQADLLAGAYKQMLPINPKTWLTFVKNHGKETEVQKAP